MAEENAKDTKQEPTFEIKDRWSAKVLFSCVAATLKIAVERAVETKANLRGADLYGANLRGANLYGADLRGADLRGADLYGADMCGANLRAANLYGADLHGAKNLKYAIGIDVFRADLFDVLLRAPKEVPGLVAALKAGKVDGSVYEGECACLVGTIANVRQCKHTEIPNLKPDSERPAERWFIGIKQGDTPETSEIVKLTLGWIEEFSTLMAAASA
jgi:hypothetical protein